ncbi:MAG: sigma-54-dependent transcriptional regulator [Magnetospiraceae bacterium]
MSGPVFLIDDEEHLRTACSQALELADIAVESFAKPAGALEKLSRDWPGVLVTDIKMPEVSGLDVMAKVRDLDPELPVILITGHGDVPMAVRAMRDGAYDFIEKPFASDVLVDAVHRAQEKRRLVLENRALRAALREGGTLDNRLVGRSQEMIHLREQLRDYAATDADVLILGETGTGKELVARSLHDLSPRKKGRFVPINCGALPDTLIESEIFGHEAGAFTGAAKARIGRIQHADGGTLFLDEIESMPLDLQIKLLRVLQDRMVTPLGGNDEIPVDVRIIAATKENLLDMVDAGSFRQDLFYRLDVLTLRIPPLRERQDDIPLLFQHFVTQAAERYKRPPEPVSDADLTRLLAHGWPGNVRELQNAALRHALGAHSGPLRATEPECASLAAQMEAVEKRLIDAALMRNGGSLKATYESLGISRKTLYDKMQRHGLTANGSDNG